MRKFSLFAVTALLVAISFTSTLADDSQTKKKEENTVWEKASINLGAFVSSSNSSVLLSGNGLGVTIDVEEALGLDTSQTVFRVGGLWRFSDNRKHRADLTWFAFRRDGNLQIAQEITIDGVTYPVGTQVNTGFDIDIYKAAYSYSFLQDDRMDIAVGGGLYIMPIRFEFSASGVISGQVSENITAPLPVIGLRGDFALTPKWFLKTHLDLFYLEFEQYKGAMWNSCRWS